jgi:hypothetical protein
VIPSGQTGGSRGFANGRPRQLFLVEVKEIAGTDLQCAGQLEDIVETDILLSALHFTDEITVDLDHLAQLFLGQVSFRAYGTQACAER